MKRLILTFNRGHDVIFASKNMRKDITQENEHKVLSMLVLEQMSFLLAKKECFIIDTYETSIPSLHEII